MLNNDVTNELIGLKGVNNKIKVLSVMLMVFQISGVLETAFSI